MKGEVYVPSFSSSSALLIRAINMQMNFDKMPKQMVQKGKDFVFNSYPDIDSAILLGLFSAQF